MFELDTRLSSLLSLNWKRLCGLILAAVVGASAAFGYASRQSPIYEARTTVLVDEAPGTRTNYEDVLANERRAQTYAYLLSSNALLAKAIEMADKTPATPLQIESLKKVLDVQAIKGTQLIHITVRDADTTRAFALTQALVDSFSDQLYQFYGKRSAKTKLQVDKQLTLVNDQIKQAVNEMAAAGESSREQWQPLLAQYRQTQADLISLQTQLQLEEARGQLDIAQAEAVSISDRPVAPNIPLLVVIGAVLGLLLGMALLAASEMIIVKKTLAAAPIWQKKTQPGA